MSRELHPDWHNEPGELPVRVSVRTSPAQAPAPAPVSRKPAAFAGILVVAGVVLSIYGGSDLFSAQIPPTPEPKVQKNDIRITEAGFEPATLTVKPGETITWKNAATIPHILTSKTIMTTDGPLETSPIFPESSDAITVKSDMKAGSYTYESRTAAINGTIVIVAAGAAVQQTASVSSAKAEAAVSSNDVVPIVMQSSSAAVSTSSAQPVIPAQPSFPPLGGQVAAPKVPVIPAVPAGMVPRNPYTVGKAPMATSSIGSTQKSSLHAGAPLKNTKPAVTKHKPTTQPETGPGNWIVAMLCAGAFFALLKNSMGKTAWTTEPSEQE